MCLMNIRAGKQVFGKPVSGIKRIRRASGTGTEINWIRRSERKRVKGTGIKEDAMSLKPV